jgi:hypothetical protein
MKIRPDKTAARTLGSRVDLGPPSTKKIDQVNAPILYAIGPSYAIFKIPSLSRLLPAAGLLHFDKR